MAVKTSQLQIRVTPRQKAMLRRRAKAAGMDISTFVLDTLLPREAARFSELLGRLASPTAAEPRAVLAELNDLLTACEPGMFAGAVTHAELGGLSQYLRNYVAAMVEQGAYLKGIDPPAWTAAVEPLAEPRFATTLTSLRPHLLAASPVPFKRRNIFIDASIGDRV